MKALKSLAIAALGLLSAGAWLLTRGEKAQVPAAVRAPAVFEVSVSEPSPLVPAVVYPAASSSPMPVTTDDERLPKVEARLLTAYDTVVLSARHWDKSEKLARALASLVAEAPWQELETILTRPAAADQQARAQHAKARVMALRLFESLTEDPASTAASAKVIQALAASLKAHGERTPNQRLDLEAMIRAHFAKRGEVMTDIDALEGALAQMGVDAEELRTAGLGTPYSRGIIVGLLTAASVHQRFDTVKAWLETPQRG